MIEPMEPWMRESMDLLVAQHGTVPPPWVVYDEHPYSVCWRMGGGESCLMLWWKWWPQQRFTEEQKIAYFRRWPPPHCWLAFVIEAIWDVGPFAEDDEEDEENEQERLAPYFERTSALGFGSWQEYERDLDDPKWFEREP